MSICFSNFSLIAETVNAYTFSFGVHAGFLYGMAFEIVYAGKGSTDYLSELQWDIKPLRLIGFSAEYGPRDPFQKNALFTSLGVNVGLPAEAGAMKDRDWLSSASSPGSLSLFSSHKNQIQFALLADLDGGLCLPLLDMLSLKLFFGISYMYFKYEAHDGYIQYDTNNHAPSSSNVYLPWDAAWPKIPLHGSGIEYSQQ